MVAWSRAAALALLLTTGVLAGCLGDDEVKDAPDVEALPASAPFVDFIHGLSVPDPDITVWNAVIEHYRTRAEDGVMLDTWIVRPDVDHEVPVVLEVTPYYGGGNPRWLFDTAPQAKEAIESATDVDPTMLTFFAAATGALVNRSYATGISSVRGTGNSGGCFTQGGPQEARDTAAVIEHIAGLPWSNGNIGLMGVSYPGTTPQDVWVEAPPALKTIVPISGISDLYKYNFVNGVPINIQGFGFNTYYWPTVGLAPAGLALGAQVTDPTSVPTAVAGEACTDQIEVQEGGVSSTLDGNKDEYWQVRDFHAELVDSWGKNPERASVLYVHGLQDWNVKPHMMEDWIDAVQDSGVPFKAVLGQWGHNYPSREDWWNTTIVAWFDHFLRGIDNGVLDAPAVQVQDDDGIWRHEARWPPVDGVERRTFYPAGDGTLSVVGADDATIRYHDNQGRILQESLSEHPALATLMGAAGQAPDRFMWRSDPLAENLTISGLPTFHGDVTASGDRASLMLTLAEELPDGRLRSINYAAQSLNHVASLAAGADSIADRKQQVVVDFFPQDDVVHAGSRLVLIASGNLIAMGPGPSLQPIADGSWITIDLVTSALVLPIDHTRDVEDPQPCWQGQEEMDAGERETACRVIR